ncbi:MAG: hypothetical protein ACTSRG_15990 [Candidatus Helarchaeota archaeon]
MQVEDLELIDRYILEIASRIRDKKRTIELDELFKECISQLSYSEQEILNSINKLYRKKWLIEGYRLTKETLLNNDTRRRIYEYIKENPGAHNRKIRSALNLGAYMAFRHLKYLEIFGFIRRKKFMNKKAYFLVDSDVSQDEKILILKNERTKIIFDQLNAYGRIRLFELEKELNLTHGQIQPHLKKLLDYGLIDIIKENNILYYIPKIEKKLNQ